MRAILKLILMLSRDCRKQIYWQEYPPSMLLSTITPVILRSPLPRAKQRASQTKGLATQFSILATHELEVMRPAVSSHCIKPTIASFVGGANYYDLTKVSPDQP